MKLITWNCNGAFRRKYHLLDEFDADVLVVQECEDPARSSDEKYRLWAQNYIWVGDNKNKGLAIFCKDGISLSNNGWPKDGSKYFISAKVFNKFNIIAVWNQNATPREHRYIAQFWLYLQANKANLNSCLIAGDFNSNKIWDRFRILKNHSDIINELEEFGIRSLYHEFYSVLQGNEPHPTLYFQRKIEKKYHIDYVFASYDLFPAPSAFMIGSTAQWLSVSDHMPLIVELPVDISQPFCSATETEF